MIMFVKMFERDLLIYIFLLFIYRVPQVHLEPLVDVERGYVFPKVDFLFENILYRAFYIIVCLE